MSPTLVGKECSNTNIHRCHADADGEEVCGYAWQSDPNLQFSWHPTLMILSMIYLYGNGEALTYRVIH